MLLLFSLSRLGQGNVFHEARAKIECIDVIDGPSFSLDRFFVAGCGMGMTITCVECKPVELVMESKGIVFASAILSISMTSHSLGNIGNHSHSPLAFECLEKVSNRPPLFRARENISEATAVRFFRFGSPVRFQPGDDPRPNIPHRRVVDRMASELPMLDASRTLPPFLIQLLFSCAYFTAKYPKYKS